MANRRAVLWDLDGTLADSREFHWRSWCDALAPFGLTITEEQFTQSFGKRNDEILPGWFGDRSTPALVREVADAKESLYRQFVAAEGLEPLPGAAAWVKRLHAEGWAQAIASSAPKANVDVMARALGLLPYMTALVGAEDVRQGKPAPDVFLTAAAAVGVSPDHCIVVEDAAVGIEAARRAGMPCIGVGGIGTDAATVRIASLDLLPPDVFEQLVLRRAKL